MKTIFKFLVIALLFAAFQSCDEVPMDNTILDSGTIQYIQLEGGFWGIVGTMGNYDPINLPEAFKIDGLEVQFQANSVDEDMVSFHMWGKLINISKMKSFGLEHNLIMDCGIINNKMIQGNPWLIETSLDKTYQAMNLPNHFRFVGYKVSFVGVLREDIKLMPPLWPIVQVIEIHKLSDYITQISVDSEMKFKLPVSGSAIVNDDIAITFNRVIVDSRCPIGVQCIWQGEAKIEISVKKWYEDFGKFEISTYVKPSSIRIPGYLIEFITLIPYPAEGEKVPNEEKIGQFKIIKL